MKFALFLSTLMLVSACSSHEKAAPKAKEKAALPNTIEEAVASAYRTDENKKRDQYRHPVETLKFFGLKPDMTVVEVYPGAGWYMEVIAPYVAQKGKYIMAAPTVNPDKPYTVVNDQKIKTWMSINPEVSHNMVISAFDLPSKTEIAPDGSADMVLTFRNVHNWMMMKAEKEAFKAFYKVLKPGGVLGVVEHREDPKKYDPLAKSGYVRAKDVIRMAKAAGFRLAAKSEINANTKDTKDHPEGVWTLPPALKLGEQDKQKYLDIGESDRMTLKFVKPLK